jgi:hypothetical protein
MNLGRKKIMGMSLTTIAIVGVAIYFHKQIIEFVKKTIAGFKGNTPPTA